MHKYFYVFVFLGGCSSSSFDSISDPLDFGGSDSDLTQETENEASSDVHTSLFVDTGSEDAILDTYLDSAKDAESLKETSVDSEVTDSVSDVSDSPYPCPHCDGLCTSYLTDSECLNECRLSDMKCRVSLDDTGPWCTCY
jgi:hypothetical protein